MSKSTGKHENTNGQVHNGKEIEDMVNKHFFAFVTEAEAAGMCPECAMGELTVLVMANLFKTIANNVSHDFERSHSTKMGNDLTQMAYEVYVTDAVMALDPLTEFLRQQRPN